MCPGRGPSFADEVHIKVEEVVNETAFDLRLVGVGGGDPRGDPPPEDANRRTRSRDYRNRVLRAISVPTTIITTMIRWIFTTFVPQTTFFSWGGYPPWNFS